MTRANGCDYPALPHMSLLRGVGCVALLALLAACAGNAPQRSSTQEAARYAAHARSSYKPPGPPEDPWGPYIHESSNRFDVPETWIRSVMRVESGGNEYLSGQLITSSAGAMGLMQVMPETYDELRDRYGLTDDPYDPHQNILAGTAYLREMYDIYGSPGFLAAYNAGPRRLDDYLSNSRPLPDETRRYVAMIGPNIQGVYPVNRSPAEDYAMNALPIDIPPGTRYGRAVQLASSRSGGGGGRVPARGSYQTAQLPEPPRPMAQSLPQQYALVVPPPAPSRPHGFRIIPQAMAEPAPVHNGGSVSGQWAIQVGAYSSEGLAQAAVGTARERAHAELAIAHVSVAGVHHSHGVLYRARLTGLSRDAAVQACERLAHGRAGCMVLSPEAQS
ncbi:MAG TPA: transglycosylase SLT domain-containing protein [Acetobacteraceae bacterium]|jgi:cell division septation protein DedD|nr:transglycosylase SLT domain-containing protein [Acetobacteraceae bacterium]